MDNVRFDRLEGKIDKLTDVVATIARVEEKIYASNMRVDKLEAKVSELDLEVDAVKESVLKNTSAARFADKFFWVIVGSIASVAAYLSRGLVS